VMVVPAGEDERDSSDGTTGPQFAWRRLTRF
jgi:hypothetical protein